MKWFDRVIRNRYRDKIYIVSVFPFQINPQKIRQNEQNNRNHSNLNDWLGQFV